MDLSMLPTDNLYKFIAMSGVAMSLGAIYLIIKISLADMDRVEKYSEITLDAYHKILDLDDVGWKADTLKAQAKLIEQMHSFAQQRIKYGQLAHKYLFGMLALGVVVSVVGFGLWYLQVQRPMDLQIQAEAQSQLKAPTPVP